MSVIHLYRAILRQAGYLPHAYLQALVKGRAGDYFRRYRNSQQPLKYLSRARADLRRLERASQGELKPFMSLLRHAYGRTGKLRHELLQPHLLHSDPTLLPREPIIPSKPSSAPPEYPPTLVSLLTSQRSITTSNPLSAAALLTPPTIPKRALNPSSEEARLIGSFSLRRLANIHKRQFNEQMRRVLAPLEVRVPGGEAAHAMLRDGGTNFPVTGLEKYDPVKALVTLASPRPSSFPKRALRGMNESKTEKKLAVDANQTVVVEEEKGSSVSTGKVGGKSRRWLRRRYRELLAEIPSITLETRPSNAVPKYKVDWASRELALAHDVPRHLRLATPEEMEWITKGELESAARLAAQRAQQKSSARVRKEKLKTEQSMIHS